ncbi:Caspase-3 [Takifugu flavidus]|uniref:Caspase-3 n=1 Tax=Takifugu flavidus TaxID=433684 RepID=A0A5C6MXG0_9TELE|nr:Caspase-3 [Takifugu flavidus]
MSANGPSPGGDFTDAKKGAGQQSGSSSGRVTVDAKPAAYSFRYSLDFPSMGHCIIINNKNFDRRTGMNTRNGTDVDAANAMKVFSSLGYKVKVHNDQTVEQMSQLLVSAAEEDHSACASFVCVLLSHGDEGVFFGTDGSVELKYLTSLFRGDRCKSLVGKPKLFFIQPTTPQSTQKIQCKLSFKLLTAPGYYSWRNTMSGSWFMQSLCDAISKYGKELELQHILTRVNHRVAVDFESVSNLPGFDAKKQIPCIVSMLTKEMYFS